MIRNPRLKSTYCPNVSKTGAHFRITVLILFPSNLWEREPLTALATSGCWNGSLFCLTINFLGKTIQTIALLAHLACKEYVWGPHLIIVPTSVILNWEMEFKKWCPAFKILTYFGSQKERAEKRKVIFCINYFLCFLFFKLSKIRPSVRYLQCYGDIFRCRTQLFQVLLPFFVVIT